MVASAIKAVKMERKKRVIAPRGTQENAESSKAAGGNSGAQLDMLAKAHEFFQICDVEGKGFIARCDMQRLHGELPLSLEELENVFDALDADGNGSLTPEEFSTGFSQFLLGRTASVSDTQECETENVYQSEWKQNSLESNEEEYQFSNLMERLGANNILEDESDIKQLWSHLRKDEPHLLSSFEEFLTKVFSQLQEADNEKSELERVLNRKIAAYDEEIQHLYEEMEQQIKNEKEKFLLKDTERFQSRSQDLEHKLTAKEQELEQLGQKQKRLEGQFKELHNDKQETKVENTKLKLTNKGLLEELERTSQELLIAQQHLQMLQDEAKKLQEEKEIEVYRVTEMLQREKSGLLKQLDFLRERNKYLRDERDECLQKCKDVPTARWKERSGSIIGKYMEKKVLPKSQSSEDDDTFNTERRRNSTGLNGYISFDSDSAAGEALTQRRPLQRLISIEEDHLPQLLNRPGEKTLTKWPEEDETNLPELEMNEIQTESPSEQTPSFPRGQPVGKETLANDEQARFAPNGLFKIVIVGNSSVGKTSFLRRFCEDNFFPGTAATVGVDYSVKMVPVDNHQVLLQFWDTAGQERYRSITKQFFRKSDGVVVMYDITAKESFTAVKQWLVSIEEAAGENIPVLLLGNKTDNEKEREIPKGLGEHLAKHTEERAQLKQNQLGFCKRKNPVDLTNLSGFFESVNKQIEDYNLIFYECSALSGDGINKSVVHLARILKEQEDKVKEKTIQLHQASKKKTCCPKQ